MKSNTFDTIVVGAGMSGGWAAKEYSEQGFKTLLLERGPNVEHLKDYPTTNMQPWEFYWVRSAEKRELLTSYCLDQNTVKTAAEMIVVVARRDTWKRNSQLMLDAFEKQEMKAPDSAIMYYKKLKRKLTI